MLCNPKRVMFYLPCSCQHLIPRVEFGTRAWGAVSGQSRGQQQRVPMKGAPYSRTLLLPHLF